MVRKGVNNKDEVGTPNLLLKRHLNLFWMMRLHNHISTFNTLEKIEIDFNATTCRKYDIYLDPYDSDYALDNFDDFMERVKDKYEEFGPDEILQNIIEHPEHTKSQLKKYPTPVYYGFYIFIDEFAEIYEKI